MQISIQERSFFVCDFLNCFISFLAGSHCQLSSFFPYLQCLCGNSRNRQSHRRYCCLRWGVKLSASCSPWRVAVVIISTHCLLSHVRKYVSNTDMTPCYDVMLLCINYLGLSLSPLLSIFLWSWRNPVLTIIMTPPKNADLFVCLFVLLVPLTNHRHVLHLWK